MQRVRDLNSQSQCGIQLCLKAIEFEEEHKAEGVTAIGFLKAKTLAVVTPGLSFLERVIYFSSKEKVK